MSTSRAHARHRRAGGDAPQRLILVYLSMTWSLSGVQLVVPAFPTMRAALELSNADVTLLMTLFLGPAALATIPGGVIADRWGRKRMLVLMLVVFGASGLVILAMPSFGVILAARVVQGMAFGIIQPMAIALIADLRTGRAQAAAQGYGQVTMNLGETLLPAIGGVLTLVHWRVPFACQCLALVLAWLVHRRVRLPEATTGAADARAAAAVPTRRVLTQPPVVALVAAGGLRFLLKYGILTFLPLIYEAAHGDNPVAIGLLLALASLFSVVGALTAPRVLALVRPSRLVFVGVAGAGVGIAALGLNEAVWALAAAAVAYGLCDGSGGVAQKSLLSVAGGARARGTVLSVGGAAANVGKFLGPALVGAFLGVLSLSGIVLVIGLGAVVTTATLGPIGRTDHLLDDD